MLEISLGQRMNFSQEINNKYNDLYSDLEDDLSGLEEEEQDDETRDADNRKQTALQGGTPHRNRYQTRTVLNLREEIIDGDKLQRPQLGGAIVTRPKGATGAGGGDFMPFTETPDSSDDPSMSGLYRAGALLKQYSAKPEMDTKRPGSRASNRGNEADDNSKDADTARGRERSRRSVDRFAAKQPPSLNVKSVALFDGRSKYEHMQYTIHARRSTDFMDYISHKIDRKPEVKSKVDCRLLQHSIPYDTAEITKRHIESITEHALLRFSKTHLKDRELKLNQKLICLPNIAQPAQIQSSLKRPKTPRTPSGIRSTFFRNRFSFSRSPVNSPGLPKSGHEFNFVNVN